MRDWLAVELAHFDRPASRNRGRYWGNSGHPARAQEMTLMTIADVGGVEFVVLQREPKPYFAARKSLL